MKGKEGKDLSIYEGDEVEPTTFNGEEMYISKKGAYFLKSLETDAEHWQKKEEIKKLVI
jgi:hypothetical protein